MVTRINGFSGMDIDAMVKSMMAAKRVPLDKLQADKQLLEWKRDSYREINSKLYEFKTNKLTDKYGVNSALNANKAIVTGNTNAIKAEATAEANGTEMKLSIERLATRATIETSGIGSGKTSSTMLAQIANEKLGTLLPNEQEALLNKEFVLTINGETFKDTSGKSLFNGRTTIATMVSTINANSKANAIASYDEISGKLIIRSKTSGATGKVEIGASGDDGVIGLFNGFPKSSIETRGIGGGYQTTDTLSQILGADPLKEYTLKINNVDFKFLGSASIDSILTKIESDSEAKASFDSSTGKLIFTSKTKDTGGTVKFGNESGQNTLLDLFNQTLGVNAQVTINGTKFDKDSNNFTVNGVALTLLTTTPAGESTTITTQTDSAKAIDTIKGFIEDYNSILELMNKKTSEVKYRTFAPLTDEQKKDMKEADIKAWTEKAQSGLLKNDDILKSMASSMRMIITGSLGDLDSMGITTGKYFEGGKLYLNESKLKKAIDDNPQRILDVLQGPASDPSSGLFDKIAERANKALEMISEKAGTDRFSASLTGTYKAESSIGRTLKGYNSRLEVMQKNLNNAENRYYKQFSAMETAMNKLQSQSNSLFSTSS
ncbi:flagellar filament capping protein FliD [Paenibacillus sp. FSL F4-0236]|uniref:flagellar filament capping protein FliD n=1 Tax=Paenibacillus sp. FSL F4-0236 TaxID=2954731 RepID=UPI0030F8737C